MNGWGGNDTYIVDNLGDTCSKTVTSTARLKTKAKVSTRC